VTDQTTARSESSDIPFEMPEPPFIRGQDGQPVDPVLERFWAVIKRLPRYVKLGVGLTRDPRTPRGAKVTVGLGGAYAVSPVDLVPGIIPVAGQLDDMVVLLLALRRAIRACPPELAGEHLTKAGLTTEQIDADLATCRATITWIAAKSARAGGRLALATGRRLRDAVRSVGRGTR
jgi:uncharacterized membrane protein YkvA (DUF1232 family)